MINTGSAYVSKENLELEKVTTDQDPKQAHKRSEVIRFKNPNKKIKFTDIIHGEIEFDTTELGDFVIARSIDEPLYHLTVVIDDHEMEITHIIRGDDGISNTPRQILIQEGIGAKRPLYAHVPLILAPDKSKLSGRHGAVSVSEYKDTGYLPQAMINFLALLGWNPGTNQEIFSMQELIESFDLNKINKSGAVFNVEKLNWFNREYIKKLSDQEFIRHAHEFLPVWLKNNSELFDKTLPLLKDKITVFSDIKNLCEGELSFISKTPEYHKDLLLWKKNPQFEISKSHLNITKNLFGKIPENQFTADNIKSAIWSYAEEKGKGDVLWPLRVALTGQEKSPDPFISAYILGKEESIKRIDSAIQKLS